MRPFYITVFFGLLVGCGDEPRPPSTLLVADAWRPVAAAEDPFDDRPAVVDCSPSGMNVEGRVYEVETDRCAYLTAVQPTAVAIEEGDLVRSVMWHLDLFAAEPAEGHAAMMLDGELLWEKRVTIPGEEAIYQFEYTAPRDFAAGTEVYFHIHNHGFNSWRLDETKLEPR